MPTCVARPVWPPPARPDSVKSATPPRARVSPRVRRRRPALVAPVARTPTSAAQPAAMPAQPARVGRVSRAVPRARAAAMGRARIAHAVMSSSATARVQNPARRVQLAPAEHAISIMTSRTSIARAASSAGFAPATATVLPGRFALSRKVVGLPAKASVSPGARGDVLVAPEGPAPLVLGSADAGVGRAVRVGKRCHSSKMPSR
jgi:hypothetical protein